jgi:hypothetical protein
MLFQRVGEAPIAAANAALVGNSSARQRRRMRAVTSAGELPGIVSARGLIGGFFGIVESALVLPGKMPSN